MATITGGEKLEAELNRIASELKTSSSVEIGFINKATYPDGTPVAAVAAFNEFGTSKSPPRPFFRTMIQNNSDKWPKNLLTALQSNGCNASEALGLVGQDVQDELQQSINSNMPPPNAESTLKSKAKRHATPQTLIDTGLMLRNVTHNVK